MKVVFKETNVSKAKDSLAEAIDIQMARLRMTHKREQTSKIPLAITDEIVRGLAYLCDNYCRTVEFEEPNPWDDDDEIARRPDKGDN
jgi:hypothetical protein